MLSNKSNHSHILIGSCSWSTLEDRSPRVPLFLSLLHFWSHLWSITRQTQGNLESICYLETEDGARTSCWRHHDISKENFTFESLQNSEQKVRKHQPPARDRVPTFLVLDRNTKELFYFIGLSLKDFLRFSFYSLKMIASKL